MSAREQTCEESIYGDKRHDWEHVGTDNPHGQCRLFDYKCLFCGAKKWIAIDPTESFYGAVYWEAEE